MDPEMPHGVLPCLILLTIRFILLEGNYKYLIAFRVGIRPIRLILLPGILISERFPSNIFPGLYSPKKTNPIFPSVQF